MNLVILLLCLTQTLRINDLSSITNFVSGAPAFTNQALVTTSSITVHIISTPSPRLITWNTSSQAWVTGYYVLQSSTDMRSWSDIITNRSGNFTNHTTAAINFYRTRQLVQ